MKRVVKAIAASGLSPKAALMSIFDHLCETFLLAKNARYNANNQYEAAKKGLIAEMDDQRLVQSDSFEVILMSQEYRAFDQELFERDHPDLFDQYRRTKTREVLNVRRKS